MKVERNIFHKSLYSSTQRSLNVTFIRQRRIHPSFSFYQCWFVCGIILLVFYSMHFIKIRGTVTSSVVFFSPFYLDGNRFSEKFCLGEWLISICLGVKIRICGRVLSGGGMNKSAFFQFFWHVNAFSSNLNIMNWKIFPNHSWIYSFTTTFRKNSEQR